MMTDTRRILEREARRAPRVDYDLASLRERRAAAFRAEQRRATAVSVLVIVVLVVGSVAILRSRGGSTAAAPDEPYGPLLAAWAPLPVAAGGDYVFLRTAGRSVASGEQRPDGSMVFGWDEGTCTSWWAPDGSGRTRCERGGDVTDDVTYQAGGWPTEVDTAALPATASELASYLTGSLASPVADGTHTPGASTGDTRLWRAADALVTAPNVPLAVRAALVEIIAGVAFADVDLGATDPVGRPAYRIRVVEAHEGSAGIAHDYFVDPATHLLLASAVTDIAVDRPWTIEIVVEIGVTSSTDSTSPSVIPIPVSEPSDASHRGDEGTVGERCSQGSNNLELALSSGRYDHDCFVVEAGAPFTVTFTIATPNVEGRLTIVDPDTGEPVFRGNPIVGPASIVYEIPALPYRPGERNTYVVNDTNAFVGTLYVR